MFDNLIESEPRGTDLKDRRRYFIVSSGVVGILFTTAVVISIFAADYGLGTAGFELVEMIAPDDIKPLEPETPRSQPSNPDRQSSSSLPTRQANIPAIQDNPTSVPDTVSTVRNTQMTRPDTGRFIITGIDSEPGNPGGSGRDTIGNGPAGLQNRDTTETASRTDPGEDTPPPVTKTPVRKPPTQSLGVINGKASFLPKPNYSAAAIALKAQGKVDVQVTIDENGRVVLAKAINGHPMLRAAAEEAAMRAKFTTTYLSGVPVKVTGVIAYNFLR